MRALLNLWHLFVQNLIRPCRSQGQEWLLLMEAVMEGSNNIIILSISVLMMGIAYYEACAENITS